MPFLYFELHKTCIKNVWENPTFSFRDKAIYHMWESSLYKKAKYLLC